MAVTIAYSSVYIPMVGSDAHNVNNIGKRIAEAVAIGEELGLIPVYFKQRKKIPVR